MSWKSAAICQNSVENWQHLSKSCNFLCCLFFLPMMPLSQNRPEMYQALVKSELANAWMLHQSRSYG